MSSGTDALGGDITAETAPEDVSIITISDLSQLNGTLADAHRDINSDSGQCHPVIIEVQGKAKQALEGLCVTFMADDQLSLTNIYFKVTVEGTTIHSDGVFTIKIDGSDEIQTKMAINAICRAGADCNLDDVTKPVDVIRLEDFEVKFEGVQSAGLQELVGGEVAIRIVKGNGAAIIGIYRDGELIREINSSEVATLNLQTARVETYEKVASAGAINDFANLANPMDQTARMSSHQGSATKKYGCEVGQNLDFGSSWGLILLAIMVVLARRAQLSKDQLQNMSGAIVSAISNGAKSVLNGGAKSEDTGEEK